MNEAALDFWTDQTSVLLTSYWGWDPETWGTVGFTQEGRRNTLLRQLSDPFITVAYVTSNRNFIDPDLKGMVAGFYLITHETGDRDEFTHPIHYEVSPQKWRHSFRAIRAFNYLPEYRINIRDFDATLIEQGRARSVSANGEIVTDHDKIEMLKSIPCVEIEVFSPIRGLYTANGSTWPSMGMVRAGPASSDGYIVAAGVADLPRELYVLQLSGNTDAFLGRDAGGRSIFKIGLSVSPDMRRQSIQKSMPYGAFKWKVHRTTRRDKDQPYASHRISVAGEDAMKTFLARNAEWLGGEFYLAADEMIDQAWSEGRIAAKAASNGD
jgi:hypothetical protein